MEKFPEKEFDHRTQQTGEISKTKFEAIPSVRELPFFSRTHYVFVKEIKTKFEGSTHFSRLSCRHR